MFRSIRCDILCEHQLSLPGAGPSSLFSTHLSSYREDAGIIYDCNGMVSEGEKSTEFYKSERNKIAIQHKDGSIGAYSILAPIKFSAGLGDYVIPGQALAVFNKESEKYLVLFSTYYLDKKKLLTENNTGKIPAPSYFAYTVIIKQPLLNIFLRIVQIQNA